MTTRLDVGRIVDRLDGKAEGHNTWRCRCPIHGGRSLIITDNYGKTFAKCHGGSCDQKAVWAEVCKLGRPYGYSYDSSYSSAFTTKEEDPEAHRRWALSAFDNAGGAPKLLQRYLRARGINMPIPPKLRFGKEVWHRETRHSYDAMVGLIERVGDGPIGVHITYLNENRSWKADIEPNKIYRGNIKGGAVRLGEPKRGEWLVVGEGIETTLSVMQLMSLPGWATSTLASLVLPDEVDKVIVAGDNDRHRGGQRKAYRAADRFKAEGRQVKTLIPKEIGDWNDVLQRN